MQNKTIPVLMFIVCLISFLGCNSAEKKEKQEVEFRLTHIQQLIDEGSLNSAKMEIDSIHTLYPRRVEERRIAKALEDTIVRRETLRTLEYSEKLLPLRTHQADSLKKNFRFEKNDTYQTVGNYVYKTLQIEQNIDRIYLRAYVDENADFFLISNFTAAYPLEHTHLQVAAGDTYASTDTLLLDDAFNHSFKEGAAYWEIVTFKNEMAGNVPAFINLYAGQRLKVTLSGKRDYHYYLADQDKKALAETYNLWVVSRDVLNLQREIQKSKATLERINQRYQQGETESVVE